MTMIDNLLSGKWSVPEFRNQYYDFYLETVPDDALEERDWEFFGEIQEKLDWTDETPDPISKGFGWLTHDEFIEWVRKKRLDYLKEGHC